MINVLRGCFDVSTLLCSEDVIELAEIGEKGIHIWIVFRTGGG